MVKKRLAELKGKIEYETNIDKNSQLIIYNNLLLDSLVTEHQYIETYPTIDKEHPLVLFSLNNTLSCDNNNIIKSSMTKLKPNRLGKNLNYSYLIFLSSSKHEMSIFAQTDE